MTVKTFSHGSVISFPIEISNMKELAIKKEKKNFWRKNSLGQKSSLNEFTCISAFLYTIDPLITNTFRQKHIDLPNSKIRIDFSSTKHIQILKYTMCITLE